jgi:hypothetical protein
MMAKLIQFESRKCTTTQSSKHKERITNKSQYNDIVQLALSTFAPTRVSTLLLVCLIIVLLDVIVIVNLVGLIVGFLVIVVSLIIKYSPMVVDCLGIAINLDVVFGSSHIVSFRVKIIGRMRIIFLVRGLHPAHKAKLRVLRATQLPRQSMVTTVVDLRAPYALDA